MKIKHLLLSGAIFGAAIQTGAQNKMVTIENKFLSRTIAVKDNHLITTAIENKISGIKITVPDSSDEFSLRISQGTDKEGTDRILTAKDFKYIKTIENKTTGDIQTLSFILKNEKEGLTVTLCYELNEKNSFLHKYLEIKSDKKVCIERINVDSLTLKDDVYQPYQMKQITAIARSKWRPGLGQPLFTKKSSLFLGTEFPASFNYVKDDSYYCGYLYGHILNPGDSLTTYKAVLGAADSPEYISDSFDAYIDKIRVRPLRLQTQYNSWFDYHNSVDKDNFIKSVNKVNEELCVKRGLTPLKAYVIDDGWQNSSKDSDWSDKAWPVNNKFDKKFKDSFSSVHKANSTLGLWVSPGCNFGAKPVVPSLRKKGWGALGDYMSLADTPYMDKLETRMTELAKDGVTFFKLDGLFGHLNRREFDLGNPDHGVPIMPQLGLDTQNFDNEALNDAKYDEAKIYYLTVGAERLIKIFDKLGKINPKIYIVISNGAWLSPWWLMSTDAVWMINAGDAAGGKSRTDELVYRDKIYYQIWDEEKTQFPMSSLFNHEPKKINSSESEYEFRNYMYMSLSRGTGFEELYLKTFKLKTSDWDIIAESMKWAEKVFSTFKRVRMHGGNPAKREVYGYTAWNKEQGYISIHNPAKKAVKYSFTLDRKFGLLPIKQDYKVSSPIKDGAASLKSTYSYGDTITMPLKPGEIRILDFKK